jgi:hypothetical protein
LKQALQGEPVQRFMGAKPVTVPPSLSIVQLVDDYVYWYHYKMYHPGCTRRRMASMLAGVISGQASFPRP